MVRSCEQAIAAGLPAIAFTEHLEFTVGGAGDAIVAIATDHRWWGRIKPLDVTGYMASIEDCRQRFPGLRIWSGVEAGEPHLFGASAGSIVGGHAFDRVLGSLHAVPFRGRLVAADALFGVMPDGDAMRYYFAELVALIEGSDLFQVLAHLDFPRRYWPKGAHRYREEPFEEEYRVALRALASSGRVLEINTKTPLMRCSLANRLAHWLKYFSRSSRDIFVTSARSDGGTLEKVSTIRSLPYLSRISRTI